MADLTAGLLTFAAALAGLTDRFRRHDETGVYKGFEVSLLGASLAVQVQRFVSVGDRESTTHPPSATRRDSSNWPKR